MAEFHVELFVGKRAAGFVCFATGAWTFHFLVWRPQDWVWGHVESWWNGELHRYGFGPLFLFCYAEDFVNDDASTGDDDA